MKLIFPNGEHAQFLLTKGVTRVGSGVDAHIHLSAPGVAAHHCDLDHGPDGVTLTVASADNLVTVNGKRVESFARVAPGDLVIMSQVHCRLVGTEAAPAGASARRDPVDDDGQTKVRQALPRFLLRGVSGATFGKTYPLRGTAVIGRHSECDISIPSDEISRRHAQLKVTADGVMVEDLGSANGTYINDSRVRQGLMSAGDELRLDTVRFLLVAPGMEAKIVQEKAKQAAAPTAAGGRWLLWASLVGLVLAAAVAGLYFSGHL